MTSCTLTLPNDDVNRMFNEGNDEEFYRNSDNDEEYNFTKEEIMDLMEECMDEDDPVRVPPISEGARGYLVSGNAKTRKKYNEVWSKYKAWCRNADSKIDEENTLINYMHEVLDKGSVGVGSLWGHYSAINQLLRVEYDKNANAWPRLRKLMKNVTKWHVPKQSQIITHEKLKSLLTEKLSPYKNHFERLAVIAIALMYFGLLRQGEVREIKMENVKLNNDDQTISVEFKKRTKSRARGFSFSIPSYLYDIFKVYINELRPKSRGENFLKNWKLNKDGIGGIRVQNMGKDQLTRVLDIVSRLLKIDRSKISGHIWRRSAATCLANSGMSLLNLKRAGRWQSLTSCERYLEHSLSIRMDRMNRLDGAISESSTLVTKVRKYSI